MRTFQFHAWTLRAYCTVQRGGTLQALRGDSTAWAGNRRGVHFAAWAGRDRCHTLSPSPPPLSAFPRVQRYLPRACLAFLRRLQDVGLQGLQGNLSQSICSAMFCLPTTTTCRHLPCGNTCRPTAPHLPILTRDTHAPCSARTYRCPSLLTSSHSGLPTIVTIAFLAAAFHRCLPTPRSWRPPQEKNTTTCPVPHHAPRCHHPTQPHAASPHTSRHMPCHPPASLFMPSIPAFHSILPVALCTHATYLPSLYACAVVDCTGRTYALLTAPYTARITCFFRTCTFMLRLRA